MMEDKQLFYDELTQEQKIYFAYNYLDSYIEDFLYFPHIFTNYCSNRVFKVLIKLLDDIGIYNKSFRYIDWKHSKRYIHPMVKAINYLEKKNPNFKEINEKHKDLVPYSIKNIVIR